MKNVKPKLYVLILLISFSACGTKKIASTGYPGSSGYVTELNAKTYATVKDKYILGFYAQELGINEKDLKDISLYRFIDEWMGVPYRIGGNSKSGIDCSGLTNLLYRNVYQVAIPRTTSQIYNKISTKPYTNLNEGDIVFMNYDGKKNSHVGIYLRNGRFFHASTSKGVMISDFNQPWYKKAYSVGGEVKR
ncbi:C40 family peptidase [Solitalea canadensis]|uniref:Cell wall-associated hydrolase, invasion-associated protein n=1 Tax=Solitalea canadensis (strain ATCC 29591 / DSM 3403 / JCM 21819 / LMG 8368 / NBRC 15130 / NCIMB 12057 / USAM 9D) TaxID=929556 RepID=H8KR56_SOLCM|nr:NlpC/P60 family protein [Solitalea canadensis]AFD07262.1 cell wall-associated hydrolase, invasion-associated protein [Solitalea canadensis DSM 3403]